jgi:hypothetical protein
MQHPTAVEPLAQSRGEVGGDAGIAEVEAFEFGQCVSRECFERGAGDAGTRELEEFQVGSWRAGEELFQCPVIDVAAAIE